VIPSLKGNRKTEIGVSAMAEAKAEIGRILEEIREVEGVRHWSFIVWRVPGHVEERLFDHDTFGSAWHLAYRREEYFRTDPFLTTAVERLGAFDWRSAPKNDLRVRRFLRILDSCGLGSEGVTIPLRGPFGDLTLLSVTSGVPAAEWAATRERILLAAMLPHQRAHRAAMGRLFSIPTSVQMHVTQRERQCLAFAAQGLTSEEIGAELGLAVSTVNSYFDTAMEKLGSSNRVNSVAKAVAAGVIPPPR
jgi:DNA-binding CsgD family transcriptional regulator